MISQEPHYPLIKLPKSIELTLYLICADLKSAKFFDGLAKVGLHDCYYRTDFSTLVLTSAGFQNMPDELFNFYFKLIEVHGEAIEEEGESVMEEAMKVYVELMGKKKMTLE